MAPSSAMPIGESDAEGSQHGANGRLQLGDVVAAGVRHPDVAAVEGNALRIGAGCKDVATIPVEGFYFAGAKK